MSDNVDLYRALHDSHPAYGQTANALLPFLLPLARDAAPSAILDYGCGKSALCVALAGELGAAPVRYDPAIPEISQKPTQAVDLVINNDVLEHIPEAQLDSILSEIRAFSPKALFTISTTLADAILENGENAHCTVRSPDWWGERLTQHFGAAHRVPTLVEGACAFATWAPSAEATAEVARVREAEDRRIAWKRRFGRMKNTARLALQPPLASAQLLARAQGKSVAIVGNAHSLAAKSYGPEIDGHDIVVRFNGARLPHIGSHGRRTDWIATSAPFTAGAAKTMGASVILWMGRDRAQLSPWMVRRKTQDFYLHPHALHDGLQARLGDAEPSSGLMLLDLVLSDPQVRVVSVFGFDFYETSSIRDGHDRIVTHDGARERTLVEGLAARDARLTLRR